MIDEKYLLENSQDFSEVGSTQALDATHSSDGLSDIEIGDIIDTIQAERSLSEDLGNPNLFVDNPSGAYCYSESLIGKNASGVLEISDNPQRNAAAQRAAGGDDRRPDDDGGHLIGARFGGSSESENLDAQNSQLNRGPYKALENDWAEQIGNGDKIFVNIDTFKGGDSDRPSAYMGYSITEHPDGSRDWDTFSFPNESAQQQQAWGEGCSESPTDEDLEAAIKEAEYTDFSGDNDATTESTAEND